MQAGKNGAYLVAALGIATLWALGGPLIAQAAMDEVDPSVSAGLFVGIREFEDDALGDVTHAVDDAIDLAHAFIVDRGWLSADRVILALSGKARSVESHRRLDELRSLGAEVHRARRSDLYRFVLRQARASREGGLFIVSVSGRGYASAALDNLAVSDSVVSRESETGFRVSALLENLSITRASWQIILLDVYLEQPAAQVGAALRGPLVEVSDRGDGAMMLTAAVDEREINNVTNGFLTTKTLSALKTSTTIDELGDSMMSLMKTTSSRPNVTGLTLGVLPFLDFGLWYDQFNDQVWGIWFKAAIDDEMGDDGIEYQWVDSQTARRFDLSDLPKSRGRQTTEKLAPLANDLGVDGLVAMWVEQRESSHELVVVFYLPNRIQLESLTVSVNFERGQLEGTAFDGFAEVSTQALMRDLLRRNLQRIIPVESPVQSRSPALVPRAKTNALAPTSAHLEIELSPGETVEMIVQRCYEPPSFNRDLILWLCDQNGIDSKKRCASGGPGTKLRLPKTLGGLKRNDAACKGNGS